MNSRFLATISTFITMLIVSTVLLGSASFSQPQNKVKDEKVQEEIQQDAYSERQSSEVKNQEWFIKNSVVNETNTMNFTLYGVANKTVFLQRYEHSQNGWVNVYKENFNQDQINEQFMSVDMTAPSESGEIRYRVLADNQILTSFKVNNHNPADYTDYETVAYKTVQKYCGNAYITTGDYKEMKDRKALGLTHTDENMIELRSDMDKETLEWVVRHECGHVLQHNAYDNNRADYSISEKRSVLWLNDELSDYYDVSYENDKGTGYSEKNADCIAYILSDTENAECIGNRRQAAYNIIQGKPVSSTIINENFANAVRLTNTGYAIEASECESVIKCSQKFENGIVDWELTDEGKKKLNFTPYDKTVKHARGYYFAPGIFDSENEGFSEYFGEES